MFERIALFGVAISFKSRTRLVAFSVTRLLKSGCQSRKYSLMHQAKWTESQRRNWTIPWKTWLHEISWHPRDIFSQYSLELETTMLGEERKNFSVMTDELEKKMRDEEILFFYIFYFYYKFIKMLIINFLLLCIFHICKKKYI